MQETNEQLKQEIKVRTKMQMQLQVLSRAVQQTASSVVITDTDAQVEYVNPSFVSVTGYSSEEVIGRNAGILKSGLTPQKTYQELWRALEEGKEWRGEFVNRRKNGELFWELAVISPIRDRSEQVTHYMAVKEDISDRKKMEAELKRLTTTDPLTGTLNRRHLNKVGEQELARARRYRRPLAMLMLDIDNFKEINDRYGHSAGDVVLQEVASILGENLRNVDHLARYGGDEFTIILTETNTSQARLVAERVRSNIASQISRHQDQEMQLSISMGVAGIESDSEEMALDFAGLIQLADKALYQAKQAGRNCVRVWGE